MLSLKEMKRLQVVQEVVKKRITQVAAAAIIGLSERQICRLAKAVRKEGEHGIVHKSRGKPSNRKISKEVRDNALRLTERNIMTLVPLWQVRSLKKKMASG